ncbi:hypothetical protein [Microbulbifer sp. GL-2]|uniref:hypothetical protein n=1 Tax=Microbulbifer sp. GL-2 TaxID=2591606 RepID=UPI001180D330|nr:hypothetical protein [Microbulbifer sp. GL-2]
MQLMDFKTTVPLRTNSDITNVWRLVISTVIALGIHAALVAIPFTPTPDTTTDFPSPLEIILLSSKNTEASLAPNTGPANPQEIELEKPQASSHPDKQGRGKSTSIPEVPRTEIEAQTQEGESMPFPKPRTRSLLGSENMDNVSPDSGAKRQATVFDPVLEKKLVRERSKVGRFQPTEANYRTATSTFVQVGDRCFDVKDSPPGNTDSDLNPWFRAKCPSNSRSRADIDRLADKYGIP